MTRRILSLWLPFWHTDRWCRQQAKTFAHPRCGIVLHEHDGRRPVVIAADQIARQGGVKPGMALAQAQSLFPTLLTAPAEPLRDAQALKSLAVWFHWLSPLVALAPPDGLWVDVTGCELLHGSEALMVQIVQKRLKALGFVSRIAIADTAGAAYALSRFGKKEREVLPRGAQKKALGPLPIVALRLANETLTTLGRLGVSHVDALRKLPRSSLAQRFGQELLRRLDQAEGRQPEPLHYVSQKKRLSACRALLEPVKTPEAIACVIKTLVADLCRLLAQEHQGVRRLALMCQSVGGETQTLQIATIQAQCDEAYLLQLLQAQIERIKPGFGIEFFLLKVVACEALTQATTENFLSVAQSTWADKAKVLERLTHKSGVISVFRLLPLAAAMPEQAQRRSSYREEFVGFDARLSPRPVKLLAPPEYIVTESVVRNGPPSYFKWRGYVHHVKQFEGPERLHDEWWRNPAAYGAMRDYWWAEDADGTRFWLFRRGDGRHAWSGDSSWYVHGIA